MALFHRARPHFSLQDAPMTPATTGKHFDDLPALAPLRKRLGELASRNILVGTSSWKYEGWLAFTNHCGFVTYRRNWHLIRCAIREVIRFVQLSDVQCVGPLVPEEVSFIPPTAMNTGERSPGHVLRRNASPNTRRRFAPSVSIQASIGSRTRDISASSPARSRTDSCCRSRRPTR